MTLRHLRSFPLLVLPLLVLGACSGDGGTAPAVDPPVITVTGVEDGEVLEEPTTVTVSVNEGTYQATLNGEAFFSGTTISEPGAYVLDVQARIGEVTSRRVVSFELRLAGESLLIVRLFDLGDNDAGGGGDAILLSDSSAAGVEHFLIDAGPQGPGGANRAFVAGRLVALGVDTLEAALLTHAHTDHYLGLRDVLEDVFVEDFVYNGQVRSLSSYNTLLGVAAQRAGEVVTPGELLAYALGYGEEPTELVVVPPLPDFLQNTSAESSELNEGSLGTAVTKGPFRMFFTGDGEVLANARWRGAFASLSEDLTALKVGHHGANDAVFDNGSSGSSAWLTHTDAALQVVSSNGTTHPRIRALSALRGQTAATYCTNVHGDIEIRVAPDGAWAILVDRNPNADCVPGSEATS